jgi:hypothetical protein
MKLRLIASLAVVALLAGGCMSTGSSVDTPALASSSCAVSTKGIKEDIPAALVSYGRKHCSERLSAMHREYVNIQFENGRSISTNGCLIEGNDNKYRVVPGTAYCFVKIHDAGANVYAAVDVAEANKKPESITPEFFVVPEQGNARFWIYSAKSGAYGSSDSVVLVRATPDGNRFIVKAYLPVANGKWEGHDRGLSMNDATLKQYAKNFRRFLAYRDPNA